jgi:hypothetical protein
LSLESWVLSFSLRFKVIKRCGRRERGEAQTGWGEHLDCWSLGFGLNLTRNTRHRSVQYGGIWTVVYGIELIAC